MLKRVAAKIRSARSPLLWDGENRLKTGSIEGIGNFFGN
jgi:hypothetical protein